MSLWFIAACGMALFIVWQLYRVKSVGSLQIPGQDFLPTVAFPVRWKIASWTLHITALFFLGITFAHFLVGDGPLEKIIGGKLVVVPISPQASRLFFFVVDRSGSMGEPYPFDKSISKMQEVQQGIIRYIDGQDKNGAEFDYLGLISFARAAEIKVPLTRTHSAVESELTSLRPQTHEYLNGSAIGYAIFKTVYLFVACQQFAKQDVHEQGSYFHGRSMIVVTDGIEEFHPADRENPFRSMRTAVALDIARDNGIRVHYVNVDKNGYGRLSIEERDQLRAAVVATGGIYGEVSNAKSFRSIMNEIAEVEGAQKVSMPHRNSMTIGFWFIVCTLIAVSASRLLESAVLRVVR